MRSIKIVLLAVILMGIVAFLSSKLSASKRPFAVSGSIYDFKIKLLSGEEISLEQYRGKYMLIVNTASKCGYTGQYSDLQKLHENYGEKVAVLGFPANDFMWQEPGSSENIADFCQKNYGVTFPVSEKISVKGKEQHPLYNWLQGKSGKLPSWNFCKYLIDKKGDVVAFFPSKVNPLSDEIIKKIQ